MTPTGLPRWPDPQPSYGHVALRAVSERDIVMAQELSMDPYVPQTGSLPLNATVSQARDWVRRQQNRHAEGSGFSFTIATSETAEPVGHCGLWLRELDEGRATAGYAIAPSCRGHGYAADALRALTDFGWTIPGLFRIALFIEPSNLGSVRTAERAGYGREGVLSSYQTIGGRRRDMLVYAAIRPHGERRSTDEG
ncbi:GNAT family N-acetyltransferase [Brevibacterium casei]|uniref:GNAT family N-acetyltransferase n=1 Tax=Brevibacterium TaxID=1696 RepID=UPI00223B3E44|nr:GNAT family N-acetyltransferase [Brevibacterium casei]MDH5147295.1 GNAT family N-acetyltransferase [Brevibacterium casei]